MTAAPSKLSSVCVTVPAAGIKRYVDCVARIILAKITVPTLSAAFFENVFIYRQHPVGPERVRRL